MTDKMTAEQAILAELRRALGSDGEVYRNVSAMLRQALTAPRVPEGWAIKRSERGEQVIIVSKNGIGGYAAGEDGRSGIAESILYHLCDDMLTAAPAPADSDPMPMPLFTTTEGEELARLRERYDALLAKHQEVLDTVQQCACAYDKPSDVCVGHAKELARMRERAYRAATELDVLAGQIAAAGIAGFGNVCKDIAARLRGGSDE